MKHGRFLPFNFLSIKSIMDLCVRSIDGDKGGGDEKTPEEAALDAMFPTESPTDESNADTNAAAPESGATDEGEKSNGEEGEKDKEPSEEQPPEVTDDELLESLSAEESTEAKVERLERERKASSTEAKRLKAENKAMIEGLEEQGLKTIVKDGKLKLVPTEKYSAEAGEFTADLSKLSTADQDALESGDLDEVSKVVGKLVEKAKEAFVRAQPNLEKEPVTLSDERKASVFENMEGAKLLNGEPKYEGFGKNKAVIERMIADPARKEAVRQAFAEDPEFMAGLLNLLVNEKRAILAGEKAEKKKAADKEKSEAVEKSNTNVSDTGAQTKKKGSNESFLDSIGNSRFG